MRSVLGCAFGAMRASGWVKGLDRFVHALKRMNGSQKHQVLTVGRVL